MYWGLYNPTERPAAPFAASWYGGEKEEWAALNSSESIDGDKDAWNTLQSLVNVPGGASAHTANWIADNANYDAVKQYLDGAVYHEYVDLEDPVVRISDDGSMAWTITRVRVRRTQNGQERGFVYAGMMTFEKRNGQWLRTGNASTFE
jgi:hypothetical protein